MKTRSKIVVLGFIAYAAIANAAPAKITPGYSDSPSQKQIVQIALLLDTSNSMDGLIDQAKSQLWRIVNELSLAEKKGRNPEVRVALYEYGNDGLGNNTGYIRKVLSFTSNLDTVSENLFALRTNGGSEYCGAVIRDAVGGLGWDTRSDVYKVIFIAGNEPFTQGTVPFREAVADAIKKDIIVNTIFCGSYQEGVNTQWLAGAQAGHGEYFNIDQGVKVVSIAAPQDDELLRLNNELNKTYIAYGGEGAKAKESQIAQDCHQSSLGKGNLSERVAFKANNQYSQTASVWDIVSAVETGSKKIEELKKEELPKELQDMTTKEREKYITENIQKRKDIQAKINALNTERRKYIAMKEKEMAQNDVKQTLDKAVINALHNQATAQGYEFKK